MILRPSTLFSKEKFCIRQSVALACRWIFFEFIGLAISGFPRFVNSGLRLEPEILYESLLWIVSLETYSDQIIIEKYVRVKMWIFIKTIFWSRSPRKSYEHNESWLIIKMDFSLIMKIFRIFINNLVKPRRISLQRWCNKGCRILWANLRIISWFFWSSETTISTMAWNNRIFNFSFRKAHYLQNIALTNKNYKDVESLQHI